MDRKGTTCYNRVGVRQNCNKGSDYTTKHRPVSRPGLKDPTKKYVLHLQLKTGIIDSSDQERQTRMRNVAAVVIGITLVAMTGTYVMMHVLANVRV